jgi:hypothetical protein
MPEYLDFCVGRGIDPTASNKQFGAVPHDLFSLHAVVSWSGALACDTTSARAHSPARNKQSEVRNLGKRATVKFLFDDVPQDN